MNKDKLDNELREKLGQARMEPPSDMWDRISATMRQQGLTAGEPAAVQPAPTVSIRRPRKLRLGYAAAAAILICAAVFGLRQFDLGSPLAGNEGDLTQEQFEIATPDQIETMIAEAVRGGETAFAETQTAQDKISASVRRMVTRETKAAPETLAHAGDVTGGQTGDTETVADNSGAGQTGTETIIPSDTGKTVQTDQGTGVKPLENAHSREGVVDIDAYKRYLADLEKKEKKRAEPVSLGLYSSNIGNTSSEKVVKSNSPLRASDFTVKEASNSIFASAPTGGATKLKHKMPLSGGLSVSKGLTGRLSVESGVTYSYLLSKGESPVTNGTYSIRQELHYVGVPVGIKYDILQSRRVDLYASAAGLFEMCVSSMHTKKIKNGDGLPSQSDSQRLKVKGIQPSIGVHAGAEVKLAKNLGLYVEPGVNYYFEVEKQPESYRTEHPFNFSLRAGFRVSLK